MLFRPTLDLFSPLTISLGPFYLERLLEMFLTKAGINGVTRMNPIDRYEKYISYLKSNVRKSTRKQYTLIQFYLGHFYQLLAKEAETKDYRLHCLEKALCHYQNYLDLPPIFNESAFYAHWQCGVLLEELGYPWEMAQSILLKASHTEPMRGESLRRIILHYVRVRDWQTAYEHSIVAIEKYFDRNPIANRRWFVDLTAYNWNLLITHMTICFKLGHFGEARAVYDRMISFELEHIQEFSNTDIRHLHALERLFYQPKHVLATA